MENKNDLYKKLHQCYVNFTGLPVRWDMGKHFAWERFVYEGYTESDLNAVVNWIKRKIKAQRRYPESLRFSNLIERLDRFEEDLAEVRSEFVKAPKVDKAKAEKVDTAESAAMILERAEFGRKMKEWREKNL